MTLVLLHDQYGGRAPFRENARIEAGPDTPAAMPVSTKMPAPIMAPTPIMVASKRLRLRAHRGPLRDGPGQNPCNP